MWTQRSLLIAMICITVSLMGCQTMRPLTLASRDSVELNHWLAPNDKVRVWMHDGQSLDLTLTSVEPDALVSGDKRIQLKDIDRIERKEFSEVRTSLLVIAIVFGVLVLGIAYAAGHSGVGIP